jgi:uncharacterized OsmC-like protein
MVKIGVEYLGDLMCSVEHTPSGNKFLTDAPLDNQGQARYISPTDTLCASLASCVATIMGIKANANNVDIKGLVINAYKEMTNVPFRRVSKISFEIIFAKSLDEKNFTIMKEVVKTCPVTRSLHPDIELEYEFKFKEN